MAFVEGEVTRRVAESTAGGIQKVLFPGSVGVVLVQIFLPAWEIPGWLLGAATFYLLVCAISLPAGLRHMIHGAKHDPPCPMCKAPMRPKAFVCVCGAEAKAP